MAGGEKTEAPTPKRLEEARKKGQVAKSADLNGAVVLFAGLLALGAAGPGMVAHIREVMTTSLGQITDPGVVSPAGLGDLLQRTGRELLAALAPVCLGPQELSGQLTHTISGLARRAAVAYLLIGLADFAYQKRRHLKSLRMDKQEVKEEAKQQQLPPEVRSALRRRQMAAARARMMAAVPTADVVVTNPTHYSVALRYDGSAPAPEVLAKGQDLVALKIRELAAEHGVPVVGDPPLARSLYASVEVGQQVPEELYEAVAQLLAFVYRVAAQRKMALA